MMYLGDFRENQTVRFMWNTCEVGGASVTRATNGTIHVYKDGASGTEVTTGVTDTEDFDSLTGVHSCAIVTADAFYATGCDYTVVLKTAEIDGEAVNAVLAEFSIENRFMRGTDSAALASVCTEARLVELAAANLPTDIDAIPGLIAALNNLSAAEVNAEVLDVMNTDTIPELTVTPPATPTPFKALMWLYMHLRNKTTAGGLSGSEKMRIRNNAADVISQAVESWSQVNKEYTKEKFIDP